MAVMSCPNVVQLFHVQPINSNVNIQNNVSRAVSCVMEMQTVMVSYGGIPPTLFSIELKRMLTV